MIDVQQLRALVELSRLGTVSAAAESLGFSQSTVSHQLAALSRATGAVLLTRAGRGVRLTEEGRALATRGQEVLDLLDRTEREVVSMARAEAGRVRLAAFPSAVASLVPGVLGVVGRQYPGLEVELVDAEPPEALDALRRGRVDAALSSPTSMTMPVRDWSRCTCSTMSSTSSPTSVASRVSPTAPSAGG